MNNLFEKIMIKKIKMWKRMNNLLIKQKQTKKQTGK